jgi:hypothetical protein
LRKRLIGRCAGLYIKEPPGRENKRARCDRKGFCLERKEKRQHFGDWNVGKFLTSVNQSFRSPIVSSIRCFSHPLTTFALWVSIGQTKQFVVPVQAYKIIDDPPVVL